MVSSMNAYGVNACGVTTHNVISYRATLWFDNAYQKLILKHQDAFQSGTAFPDFGYNCLLTSMIPELADASEAAHWPHFQISIIKYIQEHYHKPWKYEAERFIAFLLGIVSHSVSDILWHDLAFASRSGQGFIQALANANFNANGKHYSHNIHLLADVGGEFVAAHDIDLSFLVDNWYLPSYELADVYASLGFKNITPAVIDVCVLELYSEIMAIKNLPSELLYPFFAAQSPFLVQQYQDWWLGGINDMALWSAQCWNYTINSLNHGTPDTCLVETSSYFRDRNRDMDMSYRKIIKQLLSINKAQNNKISKPKKCVMYNETISFVSNNSYALLGTGIAVGNLNNDGYDDIVMGAPGYSGECPQCGVVYISYKNTDKIINVDTLPHILGNEIGANFGQAVAILDFNLDGYNDIVVSAPSLGRYNFEYIGKVYIYFGSSNGISSNPNITITSDVPYSNIGTILQTGDLNNDSNLDLIIGSPYYNYSGIESGVIWGYISRTNPINIPDLEIGGEGMFDWFGYAVKIAHNKIIVGAPGYHNFGKIYAYDQRSCHGSNCVRSQGYNLSDLTEIWTITGTESMAQLGFSLDYSDPMMILGIPSSDIQTGKVLIFPIHNLHGNYTIDEIYPYQQFIGDEIFSRLGFATGFYNDLFWISEPYYSGNSGMVYVWLAGTKYILCSITPGSLFGSVVKGLNKNNIVISAPRDSSLAPNAGSVLLIMLT